MPPWTHDTQKVLQWRKIQMQLQQASSAGRHLCSDTDAIWLVVPEVVTTEDVWRLSGVQFSTRNALNNPRLLLIRHDLNCVSLQRRYQALRVLSSFGCAQRNETPKRHYWPD